MRNWLSGWGSGHPKGIFFSKSRGFWSCQFNCYGQSLKKSQSHIVVMFVVVDDVDGGDADADADGIVLLVNVELVLNCRLKDQILNNIVGKDKE